jgi:ZIP family zinc transporter
MGLHNISEGLALGVAFGAAAAGLPEATLAAALVLTLGIGIQNLPEGMAVAVPLRCEGLGRTRSFWYGAMTATVEPLAAMAGAAAVMGSRPLMPYALGFAAGAMIFMVVEENAPVGHGGRHKDLAAIGFLAGFVVMMVLETALT